MHITDQDTGHSGVEVTFDSALVETASCWSSHGEQQETAEGAVVVAVVPDLSVVPQLQGECVALLQLQGGAVGRRVTAFARWLLVGNELDLKAVFVKHSTHGEVCGGVGCEADVVNSTNRCCEHTWRRKGSCVSFCLDRTVV